MTVTLYYLPSVAPCRAVVLAIRVLNIQDIQYVVWRETVHDKCNPAHNEFFQKNPNGTIPFLDDDGFFLTDSHTIIFYLVNKYAPTSRLLGTTAKEKAMILARVQYNVGVLAPLIPHMIGPVLAGETDKITTAHKYRLRRIFTTINKYLEKSLYIAGDELTIADFGYCAYISSYLYYGFPIITRFPNIRKWYERCRLLPGFQENEEGAKKIGNLVRSKLSEPADV